MPQDVSAAALAALAEAFAPAGEGGGGGSPALGMFASRGSSPLRRRSVEEGGGGRAAGIFARWDGGGGRLAVVVNVAGEGGRVHLLAQARGGAGRVEEGTGGEEGLVLERTVRLADMAAGRSLHALHASPQNVIKSCLDLYRKSPDSGERQ